jgi:hypothetical protein
MDVLRGFADMAHGIGKRRSSDGHPVTISTSPSLAAASRGQVLGALARIADYFASSSAWTHTAALPGGDFAEDGDGCLHAGARAAFLTNRTPIDGSAPMQLGSTAS